MEKIAILRWESGHVPQGLMQLEQLPGNSTNLASYPFPVKLVEVKGANTDTVILHPSQKLLEDMIQLAKELEKELMDQGIEPQGIRFDTEIAAYLLSPTDGSYELEKLGITEIPALGQPFDPTLHNAVMHVEDESLGENTVAEVFQAGFKLGDKVIRFSMVKVAN